MSNIQGVVALKANTGNKQQKNENLRSVLHELGFTKYETEAYIKILELGVTKAGPVYQQAGIPFGKIYDVLNSLAKTGLIEIQESRPKRYMATSPKIAFEKMYAEKKEQMEKDLQRTEKLIDELLKNLPDAENESPDNKLFWSTAIGKKEIVDQIKNTFLEAENEICIIPHSYISSFMPDVNHFIMRAYMRGEKPGLKIRILTSSQFNPINKLPSSMLNHEFFSSFASHYEVRVKAKIDSHFVVIDSEKVIIVQQHPTEPERILSVLKIWDQNMAKSLLEKFNEMWDSAERAHL